MTTNSAAIKLPTTIYPWQKEQWQQLTQLANMRRLGHALLLVGPNGLGKEAFAQQLGRWLLCHDAKKDLLPCGHCQACLFDEGMHPDLLQIKPAEAGDAIKIDAIRELIGTLNQTPQLGRYKVAIINPANAMNVAAANALLKTLEEPVAKTLIILVSSTPALLSATIRSRCQKIMFQAPSMQDAQNWLQSRDIKIDLELLNQAQNAPLLYRSWIESDFSNKKQLLSEELTQLMTTQSPSITKFSESLAKDDFLPLLDNLAFWVRETLINFADKINSDKLFELWDMILEARKCVILRVSLNQQLWLESFARKVTTC